MTSGKYIVIEGNDGTGKSTQVRLLRKYLANIGIKSVEYHEPEGTPIANRIRDVIKNGKLVRDGYTNLLLFTAARHEIWKQAERQLEKGIWVISARNYYSTLAYQGYGEGIDIELIRQTTEQFTSQRYIKPDLAIILDLGDTARLKRLEQRGAPKTVDTFEARDINFQDRVNNGYRQLANQLNIATISADVDADSISKEIISNHLTTLIDD
ncbi:dTMP kinase [Candidatus Saccharibacteria bacterium]|nr:dTMP kinase [Candidatus Saccharibacteria bacterium]